MGKIIGKGITFDDVLLVPQFSSVIPNDVVHRAQNGNSHGQTGWNRSYS